MANRICSMDGCEKAVHSRGLCGMHYQRRRKTGSAERRCHGCGTPLEGPGQHTYCGPECRPRCSVEDCERPLRKLAYCANHYMMIRQYGEIRTPHHTWATGSACAVCGGPTGIEYGRRKVCSSSCSVMASAYPDGRPTQVTCCQCGASVDLGRTVVGRWRRMDTLKCDDCKPWRFRDTGLTIDQVAERTGGSCGICGDAIDRSLKHPHPHSVSIDHILPRSRGGGDELENLRIACLICNTRRGNRTPELSL